MECMKNDKPIDYFFINGKKGKPHECLISNRKYFHFNNLNYFLKDWLIKGEAENKIPLGYTNEKNPDNCGFDRNSIKVYDLQEGQFKSWTLAAIKSLSESKTYKQNEITTWNFIEHLHERIHNIIQTEEKKRQDQYNYHHLPQNMQQEIVEKVFNTMDDSDYKRIASVTKEFITNIQPLTTELFNCLNTKDLKEAKQQFEFFNRKYDLFQKLANNINKMQKVRQGTYDFLILDKQEAQEASEELYITQNNFVYNDMQPLPPIDLDAHTFYQYAKRLVVKIEDLCMIIEANNGDELVIKKLHELMIESNKTISDIAKARTFSKRNSKVAQNPRHNKKLDFVDMYEAQYRDEIQKSISKNIDKTDLDKKIYKMASQMESKIQEVKIKNIKEWIKEYEAEYLFKVNSSKKNLTNTKIIDIINRYSLLSHKAKYIRNKKIQNWIELYSC